VPEPAARPAPEERKTSARGTNAGAGMTLVTAVIKPHKREDVPAALDSVVRVRTSERDDIEI
ncbi:MAG: hypothetical protein ACRCYQ_17245, partial [Nocardioides sp.]